MSWGIPDDSIHGISAYLIRCISIRRLQFCNAQKEPYEVQRCMRAPLRSRLQRLVLTVKMSTPTTLIDTDVDNNDKQQQTNKQTYQEKEEDIFVTQSRPYDEDKDGVVAVVGVDGVAGVLNTIPTWKMDCTFHNAWEN
jgi:hypothetical protein